MFEAAPVLLGQYRPSDSFLYRVDARAKMLPVTLVLVLALITASRTFYLVMLASLLGGLLLSGVAPRRLLHNFKPIILLVLITAAYHIIFTGRDTAALVDVAGWRLTTGAVEAATFFSLRLILFVSMAFLVTLTSSPSELADGLVRVLSPLARVRVPVQDLGLILFMAIRFIPVLYEEFETIRNAQIIRGVRFTGSVYHRIKKTVCIIIPVFVAALQRADELALAIEARGYRGWKGRTVYSRHRFGLRDWGFAGAASSAVLLLFLVTR